MFFLLGALVFVGVILLSIAAHGVVVYNYWYWFVMPVFDIGAVTFTEAIGLGMFIGLFKTTDLATNDEDEPDFSAFGAILVKPLVLLSVGFLVHALFM